jgi:hypothetical protein
VRWLDDFRVAGQEKFIRLAAWLNGISDAGLFFKARKEER